MDPFWHAVQVIVLIGLNLLVWPIFFRVAKNEILANMNQGRQDNEGAHR